MNDNRWTEGMVFDRLRHVWPGPAHVRLCSVRNGTGYQRNQTRTADAVIASVWPSRGLWLAGVEIKVTKSDWRRELADPAKAAEMSKYCSYWYVAAPKGVVPAAELPETWGLVEVEMSGASIVKAAPMQNAIEPDRLLLMSILRSVDAACVPASCMEDLAKAEAEKRVKLIKDSNTYHLNNLEASIKEFEDASGVKIANEWGLGKIGEAVKTILEAGSPEEALKGLRHEIDRVVMLAARMDAYIKQGCENGHKP